MPCFFCLPYPDLFHADPSFPLRCLQAPLRPSPDFQGWSNQQKPCYQYQYSRKTGLDIPHINNAMTIAETTVVAKNLSRILASTGAPGSVPGVTSPTSDWFLTPNGKTTNKHVHQTTIYTAIMEPKGILINQSKFDVKER